MSRRVRIRDGFTLVELLTVIAIIAILAAIIFPVFSVVRRNVHKAQCTSNLHSIAQAIKMYKDDYRLYPEALYGYQPANGVARTFLFPQYIKDKAGFRCPINPEQINANRLVPGVNGSDGQPMAVCAETGQVRQTGVPCNSPVQLGYLAWDSYDGTLVPHTSPTTARYVVHYLKKFSVQARGANDEPRQLVYRNPPDNTVVSWCTYHRGYQGAQPEQGSMDLVLFLDGRVKPVPVTQTANDAQAHTVIPSS
jgi:prepilin-type N-terminal cleavage/methylation domain-containing protein